MKIQVFRKKLCLSAVICIIVSSFAEGDEGLDNNSTIAAAGDDLDTGTDEIPHIPEDVCSKYKGAYVRHPNLGLTCCGNDTLIYLPAELMDNWVDNIQLSDCTHLLSEDNNSDMPAAFWKVSLCVFNNASVFPDGKVTFDSYLQFVTRDYPEKIKKEIETSASSCKTEADKADDVKKLQKFFECFHKSENEVCDKPFEPTEHISKSTQYNCPGNEGLLDDEKTSYCCRNESIPYSFLDFYVHFPLNEDANEKTENCSISFVLRQKELDPKLKGLEILDDENSTLTDLPQEAIYNEAELLVEHCVQGCEMLQKSYPEVKDQLKIDYEAVIDYTTSDYGAKMKQDLHKILVERKASFLWNINNKTMSLDELKKEFEGADESSKIHFYCKFVAIVVVATERTLHEYCIDKEYADKVYLQVD